jgi:hypothetical protein
MDAESAEKFNCEECVELQEITPLLVFSAFSANPLRSLRLKAFTFAGEKESLSAELAQNFAAMAPSRYVSYLSPDYPPKSQCCTDVTLAHITAFLVYMHRPLPA